MYRSGDNSGPGEDLPRTGPIGVGDPYREAAIRGKPPGGGDGPHRGYRAWPQHPPGIPARGPSEIFARLVRIHPPLDSPDRLSPDRQPHHLLVHPFLPPLCRRGADRGREVSPGRGYGGGVSAKPLSAILESILVDALGLPAAAIQVRLLRSWGEIVGPLLDGKTSPGKIRNGVLTVFVQNHAWAQELQLTRAAWGAVAIRRPGRSCARSAGNPPGGKGSVRGHSSPAS